MKPAITAIILVIMAGFIVFIIKKPSQPLQENNLTNPVSTTMQLTSSAFGNNQNIPAKYTCDGDDINPPLKITDVPPTAKSLVLIMDDPDAPRGALRSDSGQAWVHWLVWNIKPDTAKITEDSVPESAVEGKTSFGRTGWGGPCPGSGMHHYQFKLYALDTELNLDSSAKKPDLENAMSGHIMAQTVLVGLYQRR